MKLRKHIPLLVIPLLVNTEVFAGTFWFPIEGVYPYTAKVTAVPDLDQTIKSIRVRTGETGRHANGCLAYDPKYPCKSTYVKDYTVWGFLKDGGGSWDADGILITGGLKYMWYDNHTGYDFANSAGYKGKTVHAVEDGVISSVSAPWGQIGIKHVINGITYYTYYTHMDISKTQLDLPVGKKINRWDVLGTVSNTGTGGVHLHFTVKKGSKIVDPYGEWVNGREVQPYLWE